eukprot:scaffold143181_cov78-Cyclotella_meneghiniana.AAC.1
MSKKNEQPIDLRQQWAALPWTEADGDLVGGRSPFTYYHTIVKISVATPPVCRSVTSDGNLEQEEESFFE